jgi:hypothetical protein
MPQYLFIPIFLFIVGFFATSYLNRSTRAFNRFVEAFLIGAACQVFSLLIISFGENFIPTKWSNVYSLTKLVSLKDKDNLNGSFILGSAEISGEHYYTYFYEHKGGFKKTSINQNKLKGSMSEVIIFEEDRNDGELRVYNLEYAKEWHNFFGKKPVDKKYEFHVPKGSITRGFELK